MFILFQSLVNYISIFAMIKKYKQIYALIYIIVVFVKIYTLAFIRPVFLLFPPYGLALFKLYLISLILSLLHHYAVLL